MAAHWCAPRHLVPAGVGVSVHALSCFGLAMVGTPERPAGWLPTARGTLLGADYVSEASESPSVAVVRSALHDGSPPWASTRWACGSSLSESSCAAPFTSTRSRLTHV